MKLTLTRKPIVYYIPIIIYGIYGVLGLWFIHINIYIYTYYHIWGLGFRVYTHYDIWHGNPVSFSRVLIFTNVGWLLSSLNVKQKLALVVLNLRRAVLWSFGYRVSGFRFGSFSK